MCDFVVRFVKKERRQYVSAFYLTYTRNMEQTSEIEELKKEEALNNKKEFKILGISVWRILVYFILYSIAGFIIETLFGIVRYGTFESRQSFLHGPFCAIYGVGAVIMILPLQYFKKNYNTLFLGGILIGSITEYLVSFIGEALLHVKWWDYSEMPLNINGRICILYSLFWGFLGLYLIISLNPKIDKLIDYIKSKVNIKILKSITLITIIFLAIECVATANAISYFMARMIVENDIQVDNQDYINKVYDKVYNNQKKANFVMKYYSNEKMIKTFPNLKIQDKDGNIVYINSLLPEIQPYYYKIK